MPQNVPQWAAVRQPSLTRRNHTADTVGGVTRLQKTLLLVFAIAIPAAAQSAFAPKHDACFASGTATFQVAPAATAPDFRIRIEPAAAQPDLRMRLVDRPEIADFVLVDDFSAMKFNACKSATPIRTVKVDSETPLPDVTVQLTADDGPADYTLYIHSVRYSQQDAAALLAAMWKTDQRRQLAERTTH